MKPIRLLYTKNVISRKTATIRQEIEFFILIENIAFRKHVEVHWAGADRIWKKEKARYYGSLGQNLEIWKAQASFHAAPKHRLPGSIRFALRYCVAGSEYWDNNNFKDYFIDADSGIIVQEEIALLNVEVHQRLARGQRYYAVHVAVHRSLNPKDVSISWTIDNWKTYCLSHCSLRKDFWRQALGSNAENPNKYGWEIWTGEIKVGDAYRVEYAISCDTPKQKIWDNNFGNNYLANRGSLKILTLNLHCYQEEHQGEKFSQIARAIDDLQVDIVCLQEVGENWNEGRGDWQSNAARVMRDRLKRHHNLSYHLYTDWSHIGFDRYREGTAILSRYKILAKDSGYISKSQSMHDIHARKVIMAQVHVPYMGIVNIFSVHLSWWNEGFKEQFENLRRWANHRHTSDIAATFLCGDFNAKAGEEGYHWVAGTKEYEDQFLKATSKDTFDTVFRQNTRENWGDLFVNDYRIDYIFMKKESRLKATEAWVLFTEQDYGRVSDHCGYLTEFEPTN